LKYVSGINSSLARKIVKYRDEKGRIGSRAELNSVPGMGPKSFEQCAGFLRIPESDEPLDNTWVHPENYTVARDIHEQLTVTATFGLSSGAITDLREKHDVGETTIRDIAGELHKPGRDPRDDYPKPIMRKGVMTFEDIHEGMMITGKIKNVVDFGAFVDLGIKETALVHISEMSDSFIKNPLETVKVGEVMEFKVISHDTERRRIGLSRKSEQRIENREQKKQGVRSDLANADRKPGKPKDNHEKKYKITVDKKPEKSLHIDDGTMYNPFADAFKKMREKK